MIAEAALDNRNVTVDVMDEPVDQVLSVVAKRLGVALTRTGRVYYLGSLSAEDRGVLVRRVRRLSDIELSAAISVVLSDIGRVQSYPDGLVVVGDRVEVLQRVSEIIDEVEDSEAPSWVVQLYVVSLGERKARELGVDVQPGLELSYLLASSGGDPASLVKAATSGFNVSGSLDAVLQASLERSGVEVMADPLMLIADGAEARFVRGDSIPIPQRTISDQGTVTTTDFSFVQTGLEVLADVREMSAGRARLTIDVRLSTVRDMVEDAPVTSDETFSGVSIIESGGVYLLGSLRREDRVQSRIGGWGLGWLNRSESSLLQVWARAYRVAGPVEGGTRETAPEVDADRPTLEPVELVSPVRLPGPHEVTQGKAEN